MSRETCPRIATAAALAVLSFAIAGCSKSSDLPRVLVIGEVSYEGQPVEAGQIRFRPLQGTRGPITIAPIENGKYTTELTDGVPIGNHRIEVFGYDAEEYAAKRNRGPGTTPPEQLLPEQFNKESILTCQLDGSEFQVTKDFRLEP